MRKWRPRCRRPVVTHDYFKLVGNVSLLAYSRIIEFSFLVYLFNATPYSEEIQVHRARETDSWETAFSCIDRL